MQGPITVFGTAGPREPAPASPSTIFCWGWTWRETRDSATLESHGISSQFGVCRACTRACTRACRDQVRLNATAGKCRSAPRKRRFLDGWQSGLLHRS